MSEQNESKYISTKAAAEKWEFSESHVRRLCTEGKIKGAEKFGRNWAIPANHPLPNDETAPVKKSNWRSLQQVFFEGKTLVNAGYAGDKNDTEFRISQFYVDIPDYGVSNHYNVAWDFSKFFKGEAAQTFEWLFPHNVTLEKDKNSSSIIEYFSGPTFTPYNKTVKSNDLTLIIINRPVKFSSMAGSLVFWAGAVDPEGNQYKAYWNLFNMFEPVDIKLMVDNTRYCTKCLKRWTRSATNEKCDHEWASAID